MKKNNLKKIEKYIDKLQKLRAKYAVDIMEAKSNKNTKILEKLEPKMSKVNNQLIYFDKLYLVHANQPIMESDIIDLYKKDNSPYGYYEICLHGTKDIIGHMGCQIVSKSNNISYFIQEKYRNKGYAYQSLVLLLVYLEKKDVQDIRIAVNKDNTYSLKIASKISKDHYLVNAVNKETYYEYKYVLKRKEN